MKSTEKFKYASDVQPHPWHTLKSDLLYWKKQDILILVDFITKYLIVMIIPNSTRGAVIQEFGIVFSEYGRPYILKSDNDPCCTGVEFDFWIAEMGIKHRTIYTHYPQSNGLAESMVKVSKSLIEKLFYN